MQPRAFSRLLAPFKRSRTIITFHSLGDLDAVGAAIALSRFLGKSSIIAPPDAPSSSARRLIDYLQLQYVFFDQLSLTPKDKIIVLDSASLSIAPHLKDKTVDLSIDHHSSSGIRAKKRISDPSASSTCELLYFLLKPTDKVSALALLLGIISDSAGFQNASSKTFEAVSCLVASCGLSYSVVQQLAHAPQSFSERIEALRSCQTVSADKIGQHIIATAVAKSHEAHFADLLVSMGADLAFVGCIGHDGRICARMRDSLKGKIHLGQLMAEAAKVLEGSSGGHEFAAAASGKRENVKDALSVCLKLAEQQLLSFEDAKIKKIEW
ncbi:MAG: DHH family phosphoesterase [Candidatus Micrarchaeota archaeon]|nr:DHH family phosphoesterase [Candidatus Micrarchaeota archaeon]